MLPPRGRARRPVALDPAFHLTGLASHHALQGGQACRARHEQSTGRDEHSGTRQGQRPTVPFNASHGDHESLQDSIRIEQVVPQTCPSIVDRERVGVHRVSHP